MERNIYKIGKELFITSDEEIKKGDWCYHPLLKWGSVIKSKYDEPNSTMKKIILTTDQDLINDGVQAIDDEFLEWFVKNPSCEYIEIENIYDKFLNGDKRSVTDFSKKYKIIFPIDDNWLSPMQEYSKTEIDWSGFPKSTQEKVVYVKDKQETLEEAAERIANNFEDRNFSAGVIYGVIEGAKLREKDFDKELEVAKHLYLTALKEKERMFNNEEVYQILNDSCEYIYNCAENGTDLELMPTLLKGFFQQYHK